MGGEAIMDRRIARIAQQESLLKEKVAAGGIHSQRSKLCRYRPGDWILEAGGFGKNDFAVPKMSTLLVVGPMGAGKSTLVNNLIRTMNQLDAGYDRAQVSGDPTENGTLFLKEYMLCDRTKNVCIFDTRGFAEVELSEDMHMLKKWMLQGVCHGEIARRSSDSKSLCDSLDIRARHGHHKFSQRRHVNFVIFVVSAVAIHNMNADDKNAGDLARLYKSSFLAFKDDKPVVVMTHGDLLTPSERTAARLSLGEMLAVSPVEQIFDIPAGDCADPLADMAMLDMLEFALMRADRNLPFRPTLVSLFKHQLVPACTMDAFVRDPVGKNALLVLAILWLLCLSAFVLLVSL